MIALDDSVNSVAFSPDGQRLVSGSDDNAIRVWNMSSGSCLQTLGHSRRVFSVAFSPDGQWLVSCSEDSIKVWDTISGGCHQTLEGHGSWIYSVTFSPDGQRLASGSHDKTIKVWDTISGGCLQTLEGHSGSVRPVVFHQMAGCSHRARTTTRLRSGIPHQVNASRRWRAMATRFLSCLRRMANSSHRARSTKTIKVWDVAIGDGCPRTLEGHSRWIHSVVFSPDGQRLYIRLLRQHNKGLGYGVGLLPQTLDGHSNSVHSVAFSLDNAGRHGYRLGKDNTWIICNGRNVLWLPPEHRPSCSAVEGRMISIGCQSGRVLRLASRGMFSRFHGLSNTSNTFTLFPFSPLSPFSSFFLCPYLFFFFFFLFF